MKLAPACKTCPWRDGGYVYDDDGREAVLEGYEASCHCIVGTQAVFHHQPARPGPARSAGGQSTSRQELPDTGMPLLFSRGADR